MAASDSSCSSRNQTADDAFLPDSFGKRTEFVAVHKSRDLFSDATNDPPAASLKPVTICIDIASSSVKGKSALPETDISQSIIHSSWIQRLKPSSLRRIAKDELSTFPKKDGFVCTHFTKDYSSCNRHVHNVPHHIRSSSWPPPGNQSTSLALEVDQSAYGHTEERDDAAESIHARFHSNICVSLKNASQCREADCRSERHHDHQTLFSNLDGFNPCAQLTPSKKLSSSSERHLWDSDKTDSKKLPNQFGQINKDCFKDEKKAEFFASCELANSPGRLPESKGRGHLGRCFSMSNHFANAPALPLSGQEVGYSSGASADADVHYRYCKPIDSGYLDDILPRQLGLGKPELAVKCSQLECSQLSASRNFEKRGEPFRFLLAEKEAVQDGMFRGCKGEGAHSVADSKQEFNSPEGADAREYLQSATVPHHRNPSRFNFMRAGACTGGGARIHGDVLDRVRTSQAKQQNIASKRFDPSYIISDDVAKPQNPQSTEEGKMPLTIKSVHEDAVSIRIREKSLESYWNSWLSVLEEPADRKNVQTGTIRASSKQENSHKPSTTAEDVSCNNSNHKNLFSSKFIDLGIQFESNHVSNFKVLQNDVFPEQYGGTSEGAPSRGNLRPSSYDSVICGKPLDDGYKHSRTLSIHLSPKVMDSEARRREDICCDSDSLAREPLKHQPLKGMNNERSVNKSTLHHGWLQRWRSIERFPSDLEKPLGLCSSQIVRSDHLSSCTNTQCILGSRLNDARSSKGKLAEFGNGCGGYSRAFETLHYSGRASVPNSQSAVQNFSSFRSGYQRSSVKAMAIVGNSASAKRDGHFIRLPHAAESLGLGYIPIAEDGKNIEDDVAHVDLDGL